MKKKKIFKVSRMYIFVKKTNFIVGRMCSLYICKVKKIMRFNNEGAIVEFGVGPRFSGRGV